MQRLLILFSVLLLTSVFTFIKAQPVPPSGHEHLRLLKKELRLDESQTEKVKDILKSSQAKMKELRDRIETQHENDMEEMDKILDGQNKQISEVLNDSQKKKFEEMKDEMPAPGEGFQPQMKGMPGMPHPRGGFHGPLGGRRQEMDNGEDTPEANDEGMLNDVIGDL